MIDSVVLKSKVTPWICSALCREPTLIVSNNSDTNQRGQLSALWSGSELFKNVIRFFRFFTTILVKFPKYMECSKVQYWNGPLFYLHVVTYFSMQNMEAPFQLPECSLNGDPCSCVASLVSLFTHCVCDQIWGHQKGSAWVSFKKKCWIEFNW